MRRLNRRRIFLYPGHPFSTNTVYADFAEETDYPDSINPKEELLSICIFLEISGFRVIRVLDAEK